MEFAVEIRRIWLGRCPRPVPSGGTQHGSPTPAAGYVARWQDSVFIFWLPLDTPIFWLPLDTPILRSQCLYNRFFVIHVIDGNCIDHRSRGKPNSDTLTGILQGSGFPGPESVGSGTPVAVPGAQDPGPCLHSYPGFGAYVIGSHSDHLVELGKFGILGFRGGEPLTDSSYVKNDYPFIAAGRNRNISAS